MPSNNRVSNIETKLIYLFGKEETKIDLIIGKKYAELFGELPNQNRNIIKDCKMKKKLISLFGVVRKPVKIIKKKKSKKLEAQIKNRLDHLFGVENTKKDKIVAKKILHLFGQE